MEFNREALAQLLQQLENDKNIYLNTQAKVHDILIQALSQQNVNRNETTTTPAIVPQAPSVALHRLDQILPSSPKLAPSLSSRRTGLSTLLDPDNRPKDSVYTGDSEDSDDNESFFAQLPLPKQLYTQADLIQHLKDYKFDQYSNLLLCDLIRSPGWLAQDRLFESDKPEDTNSTSDHHSDIFDVGGDGAPLRVIKAGAEQGSSTIWEALRSVNADASRRQAVGRITIMREPTSLLMGALHLVMKDHFDMDSLYRMLIDDDTITRAYTRGFLSTDHRQQRSIVFCFKYHTLIDVGRRPLRWQNHDDDLEETKDNIPISTCSSVVALSLSGFNYQTLRRHSRKSKNPIVGRLYDPFSPWHVLSLQCYPDWKSSVDVHETHHHYVNGSEAFLITLLSEYRDATKRFKELNRKIVNLATPPKKVIFRGDLRDKLLFENDDYKYTRRYFWAAQTLAHLSDEMEAMISAYKDTFTDDVWSGEHKTLFPGTTDQSARYQNWRKRMANIRKQFDKVIQDLEEVLRINHREQKDIRGLREWLFSGTSVEESREAVKQARTTVEQGYNIKLLTLVSIFFLPLTFVTSVYGMTNMPPEDSFIPFGITTVCICLPTYVMIAAVNSPERLQRIIAYLLWLCALPLSCFPGARRRIEQYRKTYEEGRSNQDHSRGLPLKSTLSLSRSATNSSLEGRLTRDTGTFYQPKRNPTFNSSDLIIDPPKPSPARPRGSTIKFEVPAFKARNPSKAREGKGPDLIPSATFSEIEMSMVRQPSPLSGGRVQRKRSLTMPSASAIRRLSDRFGTQTTDSVV